MISISDFLALPSIVYTIFLENPLAQSVGFFAFAMSMLTFLSGNDAKFMQRMTISSAIWAAHFLLLGALSAGILNVIDVFKNILAIKYPMNKRIAAAVVCVYIMVGITLFSLYQQWTDLLPVAASVASTIILFTLKGLWMRIAFLGSLLSWVVYNYYTQSIGGLSTDIVLFFTGVVGIWNTYREEKEKNTTA